MKPYGIDLKSTENAILIFVLAATGALAAPAERQYTG